jgi:hypothetical protein
MTDRTMCNALAGALNDLTRVERAILTTSARDGYNAPGWLGDIKIGLAGQLLEGAEQGQVLDPALVEALDNLEEVDRRTLARLVGTDEVEVPAYIARLLYGVALQLEADEWRHKVAQDAALAPLAADHQAEVEVLAAAATWPTEPEDRSKGVAWFPWHVPDTIEGLDTPCA